MIGTRSPASFPATAFSVPSHGYLRLTEITSPPAPVGGADLGGRPQLLSAAGKRVLVEGIVRAVDILAVGLSGAAVISWRLATEPMPAPAASALLGGCLFALNLLPLFGLYRGERLAQLGYQIPRVLTAWAIVMATLMAVLFAMKLTDEVSRLWIGTWFVVGALALIGARVVVWLALTCSNIARAFARHVVVVGLGDHLLETLHRLPAADPCLCLAAVFDLDGSLEGRWPKGVARLNSFAELERRAAEGSIDQILLALPGHSSDFSRCTLRKLRHLATEVSWIPELPAGQAPVLGTAQIGDLPLVRLLERPLDAWRYTLKAMEDRVLAALLLIMAAPIMGLVALALKLDTPGPVFYRQRRHGISRKPIAILKFRSMHATSCDPLDANQVRQATRDDPRITRVGRILRRTSLDELPQLWNVLMGDMSLVGPRPHAVAHDQHYAELIDDYLGRHRVKPGITGWAQVHGFRGETKTIAEMRRRIELDLEYIDNWSLWLDFRILARTALSLRQARAY